MSSFTQQAKTEAREMNVPSSIRTEPDIAGHVRSCPAPIPTSPLTPDMDGVKTPARFTPMSGQGGGGSGNPPVGKRKALKPVPGVISPIDTIEARKAVIAGATDWREAARRLAAAGYQDGVIQRARAEEQA
ncbi:MAG: hypothetical protein ACLGIS_14505 [Actinomycetes bacterium]